MKKKIIIVIVCILAFAGIITGTAVHLAKAQERKQEPVSVGTFLWEDNGDIETVKKRITSDLFDNGLDVSDILESFDYETGAFTDIDYDSDKKDTWHPIDHLKRMKDMQIACYSPENSFYQNEKIKEAVLKGMNFWAEKEFYCDWNGWFNDIGIGLYLPDILLFGVEGLEQEVQDKLTGNIKKNDLENSLVYVQVKEREVNPNGANLTDNVLSSIKIALIENDGNKIMWLKNLLEREVRPFPTYNRFRMHRHDADGIKEDMSMLMHWHLLYFGGYGEVFVNGMNRYIKYTKDTQYCLSTEGLDCYADYILDGQQYAFRDVYRDISASGRGIAREGSLKGISVGVRDAAELLSTFGELTRLDEIKSLTERRFSGKDKGAGGHRFFYESDYGVYNGESYMATVRHSSNRTRIFEFLNDENPLGYYTGFGATFYYNDGSEYFDLPPLFDWNKIPGTTTRQGFLPTPDQNDSYNEKGNTKNTAGVSDGSCGASYISLNRHGVKSEQAYFMFEDGVICLGNGISSSKKENIVTSINQTRLESGAFASENGERTDFSESNRAEGKFDYVFNNGISYITDSDIHIISEKGKEGDWKTLNQRNDSKIVTGDLFTLYTDHGKKPHNASYAYTVLMNTTPEKTEEYIKNPTLCVIRNDKNVQAVYDSKNDVLTAVFRKGDEISLDDGTVIAAGKGCLIILSKEDGGFKLTASSDDFGEHNVKITVNGTEKEITVTKKSQSFTF